MSNLALCVAVLLTGCAEVTSAAAADEPVWELTFAEEGDGAAGAAPDDEKWTHDVGGHGWGNEESQTYTPGNANVFYDGDGLLIIEARRENHTGADGIAAEYTSARIKSQGLFSQRYGKMEARLKIPAGQGIWPAFWMLGATYPTVGWPACGEIDIMENVGNAPTWIHGTLHGPGYSAGNGLQGSLDHPDGKAFADDFHVYAVEWEPKEIRWYIDGKLFHTRTPEDAGPNPWAYDVPHFLILNIAVGGAWPGYPDESTVFPQRMLIDFVRVYRDKNLIVDEAELAAFHAERIERFAAMQQARLEGALRPTVIPGELLAAHFRAGGEGVAYHDSDDVNEGNAFRMDDGVDLSKMDDEGVDFGVGWTAVGEWLTYDIDVEKAGTYRVDMRVASQGPGGVMRLSMDGQPIGEPAQVPDTGSWQTWQTVPMGQVRLAEGRAVLRLTMAEAGPALAVGNVSKLIFTRVE